MCDSVWGLLGARALGEEEEPVKEEIKKGEGGSRLRLQQHFGFL